MAFDINTLRSLVTLLAFVMFLALMVWAWRGARRQDFEEAANLPFAAHDNPAGTLDKSVSADQPRSLEQQ
jgi:cytochrome c oxidase cbb3-type subunit IV